MPVIAGVLVAWLRSIDDRHAAGLRRQAACQSHAKTALDEWPPRATWSAVSASWKIRRLIMAGDDKPDVKSEQ